MDATARLSVNIRKDLRMTLVADQQRGSAKRPGRQLGFRVDALARGDLVLPHAHTVEPGFDATPHDEERHEQSEG